MTTLRRVTGAHAHDSELVRDLVGVFVAARKARLQFLIDLHDEVEDAHYLSGVVLPANDVWVADSGGGVVGFIAFAPGWVNQLYVDPAYQGRGTGRRLLAIAKDANPTLDLWAFEANAPAVAFYEREGFHVVERTNGAGNEAKMPDVRMEWVKAVE